MNLEAYIEQEIIRLKKDRELLVAQLNLNSGILKQMNVQIDQLTKKLESILAMKLEELDELQLQTQSQD